MVVKFQHREPIGSSTYPMPDGPFEADRTLAQLGREPAWMAKDSTIYLHIPFCDQICSFCGFNKFVSGEDIKGAYVEALIAEINTYGKTRFVEHSVIKAVYFGGGTPNSLSPEQLRRVLAAVHEVFPLSKDCEITCEGTPMNFTSERNSALLEGGVSRVSAGIQTFDRNIRIAHLHMREGKEELLGYIDTISRSFQNFNLDLIFNLPGQTNEIWHDDLETAIGSVATHLTVYPLVLLEHTIFYTDYVRRGVYDPPSEEREIEQFIALQTRLAETEFGRGRYTVRDWARPGQACRYIDLNSRCVNVIALGAGAHGYIGNFTYRNEKAIARYVEVTLSGGLPIAGQRFCSPDDEQDRFMVMGLRRLTLDLDDFRKRFGESWEGRYQAKVDEMIASGYISLTGSVLSYTDTGLVWANNVRSHFESRHGTAVGYTDTPSIGISGKDHYSQISRVKATDAEIA